MPQAFTFIAAATYTGETIHDGGTVTIAAITHGHTIRMSHGFTSIGTAFDAVDVFAIRHDVPLRDTAGMSEAIFNALTVARKAFHATRGLPVWPPIMESGAYVMG